MKDCVIDIVRQKKYYIITLYLVSLVLDLLSTYYASPDLKYESHFIVRYLHMGWGSLLLWNVFVAAVLIFLFLKLLKLKGRKWWELYMVIIVSAIIIVRIPVALFLAISNMLSGFYLKQTFNYFINDKIEKFLLIKQEFYLLNFLEVGLFVFIFLYFLYRMKKCDAKA